MNNIPKGVTGCARSSLDESVGLVTTLVFIMAVSEIAPARLLLAVSGAGIAEKLSGFPPSRVTLVSSY